MNKWMTKAEAACAVAVKTANRMPRCWKRPAEAVLGEASWRLVCWSSWTDPHTNSPVLLFHYPSSQPGGFEYLKRAVKLEFGSLTDQKPVGRHPVRPWVADVLPVAFPDWQCEVVVLEVERSFWEKATIPSTHTEYPPAGRETNARPVLPPLRGYGGAGPASDRKQGNRPARPPDSGCSVEGTVFWQFVGQVRPREAGDLFVSSRRQRAPTCPAA